MSSITQTIGVFFAWLLGICHQMVGNYGWAIWVFTFLTKIILLPVSILVQVNSIKMVKMYPEMNRIKVKYFGDKDMISEEQYSLYKKYKYNPFLDLIPVIIQLILLMGVVEGIYNLMGKGYEMTWLGLDLTKTPVSAGGMIIIIPIVAGLSALLMCITQNISNVLQSEQSKANKITTLSISVGLSLYLGLFVPAGIGLYWIAGNIFSIIQMYALNFCINPRKHIDYDALEASKAELKKVVDESGAARKARPKEEIARENADYKRFLKYGHKQVVFYAERNGFYKYYKGVIEYILAKTDIDVHYISSDPDDAVFGFDKERLHTYYIGDNKFIVLAMKLEADVVVMTTPDLQNFQIKRSYVDKNIEYIYLDHAMGDVNASYRKHALDHFDTVFIPNDYARDEIRAQEKTYSLKEKKLVEYGYALIDNMIASYENNELDEKPLFDNDNPMVLIAPSWQKDNIMDLCIDDTLKGLLAADMNVVLRPHPQYVRHYEERLNTIREKYKDYKNFLLQTDFSSNSTVYNADMLITDWSGIAYEYTFTTLKPVVYIDTPMKIMNLDYKEIGIEPFEVIIRNVIGTSVSVENVGSIGEIARDVLSDEKYSKENLKKVREEYLYNIGSSAKVGATYIIKRIIEKSK